MQGNSGRSRGPATLSPPALEQHRVGCWLELLLTESLWGSAPGGDRRDGGHLRG